MVGWEVLQYLSDNATLLFKIFFSFGFNWTVSPLKQGCYVTGWVRGDPTRRATLIAQHFVQHFVQHNPSHSATPNATLTQAEGNSNHLALFRSQPLYPHLQLSLQPVLSFFTAGDTSICMQADQNPDSTASALSCWDQDTIYSRSNQRSRSLLWRRTNLQLGQQSNLCCSFNSVSPSML